jgi:hypothetical protein
MPGGAPRFGSASPGAPSCVTSGRSTRPSCRRSRTRRRAKCARPPPDEPRSVRGPPRLLAGRLDRGRRPRVQQREARGDLHRARDRSAAGPGHHLGDRCARHRAQRAWRRRPGARRRTSARRCRCRDRHRPHQAAPARPERLALDKRRRTFVSVACRQPCPSRRNRRTHAQARSAGQRHRRVQIASLHSGGANGHDRVDSQRDDHASSPRDGPALCEGIRRSWCALSRFS